MNYSAYHSVSLKEDLCKGCTVCVTGCPVEAIRVRGGKAHILEERCIDCGECIRCCQSKAKIVVDSRLALLSEYDYTVALAAPSFYAQFNSDYSEQLIAQALKKSCGFDDVYNVSSSAFEISKAAAAYITAQSAGASYPVISSSCPAVVKLIQIRFPSLIDNLLPFISPMELAARTVRSSVMKNPLLKNKKTGIFFISPCPAKMTEARSPIGIHKSDVDGVLSFSTVYAHVLSGLKKVLHIVEGNIDEPSSCEGTASSPDPRIWCSSSGEAECLSSIINKMKNVSSLRYMSVSGIKEVLQILEYAENGEADGFGFLEVSICEGGCLGGPLSIVPSPVASSNLRERLKKQGCAVSLTTQKLASFTVDSYLRNIPLIPRPSRLLNRDFKKARKMMEEIEQTLEKLPGLDCGSCGAPNCRAFAEDFVKKDAKLEDCVIILKQQYEKLLFGRE